jgi:hypothetical protein
MNYYPTFSAQTLTEVFQMMNITIANFQDINGVSWEVHRTGNEFRFEDRKTAFSAFSIPMIDLRPKLQERNESWKKAALRAQQEMSE